MLEDYAEELKEEKEKNRLLTGQLSILKTSTIISPLPQKKKNLKEVPILRFDSDDEEENKKENPKASSTSKNVGNGGENSKASTSKGGNEGENSKMVNFSKLKDAVFGLVNFFYTRCFSFASCTKNDVSEPSSVVDAKDKDGQKHSEERLTFSDYFEVCPIFQLSTK
uniref:Uncharacterized protein n=1 Tax=Meloidogyne javanica TaxID=6303 RepID=A0A915MY49_MELJA